MRLSFAVALLLAVPAALLAQPKAPEKVPYAPTPTPDRVVLTWRGDPARTQAVTWRTDTSVAAGVAEYAEAGGGPDFEKKQTVKAGTSLFKSDDGSAHFHSAHFEGLLPNTKYAYRVGDGTIWSEWNHFKTASEKHDKFSFLYVGDAQVQLKVHWSRVVREAFRAAPDARFSIHAGDLVNYGGRDAEWGEWFQAAEPINRTIPVVPVPGNHEYMHTEGPNLPTYWLKQFALPTNGPKEPAGVFYFDFQGVRIVCLNSQEVPERQVDWLHGVLQKNPNRWTIATFHHPIYSAASGRDNPALRNAWKPIFEKYKVDLILQGHDHCYGRSGLRNGPVYVVSVSGPQFYSLDDDSWMVRKGERLQFFQVITIDGDSLHFEARTAAGDLYDSFTLRKQNERVNLLTDGPHDPRSVPSMRIPEPWASWLPIVVILVLAGFLVVIRLLRQRRKQLTQ